jgi:hypothetical protein
MHQNQKQQRARSKPTCSINTALTGDSRVTTYINACRGRLALPAENVQSAPVLCLDNGPIDSVV